MEPENCQFILYFANIAMIAELPPPDNWIAAEANVFWNKLAPNDHLVQLYDNDAVFLNSLQLFATTGFDAGESVIVIATNDHLNLLEERLMQRGYDVNLLFANDHFIPLNADDLLSMFMVNGMPDERLFMRTVSELVRRAKNKGRNIRAFGEMVLLLWERGNTEATIQLEALWNKFCAREKLCLFCAYLRDIFIDEEGPGVHDICSCHSKEIAGWNETGSKILYRATGS